MLGKIDKSLLSLERRKSECGRRCWKILWEEPFYCVGKIEICWIFFENEAFLWIFGLFVLEKWFCLPVGFLILSADFLILSTGAIRLSADSLIVSAKILILSVLENGKANKDL